MRLLYFKQLHVPLPSRHSADPHSNRVTRSNYLYKFCFIATHISAVALLSTTRISRIWWRFYIVTLLYLFLNIMSRIIIGVNLGCATTTMSNNVSSINIQCPKGHQIYSIRLRMAVNRKSYCSGYTPGLIINRNLCMWKKTCFIKLNLITSLKNIFLMPCMNHHSNELSINDIQCIRSRAYYC